MFKPRKSFSQFIREHIINESVSVYVQGYDNNNDVRDLFDLSVWLQKQIIFPLLRRLPNEQIQLINQTLTSTYEILVPDGNYFGSNQEPTLNFYTIGWTPEQKNYIINQIKQTLDKRGIKYGPFREEQSGMHKSSVVRIPILSFQASKDIPPDLNLSNNHAAIIFRDLLQLSDNEASFSMHTYEVLQAVERVRNNPDLLDIHANDPHTLKYKQGPTIHDMGYDKNSIIRTINQLEKIAQWAVDHGFDTLYVA